jgi:hypothetical protein
MHHLVIQPLLGFDFTELIITAVVLIFAVMKQLFDASSKTAKKTGTMMPAQPPQRPAAGGPKPVPPGGQQADALRSQVEEFLRRAGGQPQTNQAPPATQRPVSEIELLVRQPQRLTQLTSAASGEKQRMGRRGRRRQSVAEHVAEAVTASTQTLAEKANQLGQRIVTEDQQFDNQLKSKFDHAIGTLGEAEAPPSSVVTPNADTPASRIAAMFGNATGVQQAVMMNEILRRPSDRW